MKGFFIKWSLIMKINFLIALFVFTIIIVTQIHINPLVCANTSFGRLENDFFSNLEPGDIIQYHEEDAAWYWNIQY